MTAHEAETGVKCSLHRVPFFLESDYIDQPEGWWEPHETRMVRKFGSKEAFESLTQLQGAERKVSVRV